MWDIGPSPSDTFPSARPHLLNFPKQHHQLGTSVQMPEPPGDSGCANHTVYLLNLTAFRVSGKAGCIFLKHFSIQTLSYSTFTSKQEESWLGAMAQACDPCSGEAEADTP